MPDPTDLSALITRVEAATGPDRELDLAIAQAFSEPWAYTGEPPADIRCARLTASIDAALALVERVLPGWAWIRQLNGAMVIIKGVDQVFAGQAKTPALALLLALLRALQELQRT